jgi:hypothetical protein
MDRGDRVMPMVLDLREEARRRAPAVPSIPHLAASARQTWLGRMVNEYASSAVFEALGPQLERAGFGADVARECGGFAAEERRHGILCGAVVEALGGEARAEVSERAPFPEHADASAREGALRNVLSVACLSETVAVSLIGAERIEMPEGPLRALLTGIYADEIGHARFGWRLAAAELPKLTVDERRRLGRYLAAAFAHLEAHELAHLPAALEPPREGVALGLCSGADARLLFYETVDEVIVPRLESLGLDAGRAWAMRGDVPASIEEPTSRQRRER